MSDQGWGGDARKAHYIRDGRAVCGRVPPDFDPKIEDCYSPAQQGTNDFCLHCLRICLRAPWTQEVIVSRAGVRVIPTQADERGG